MEFITNIAPSNRSKPVDMRAEEIAAAIEGRALNHWVPVRPTVNAAPVAKPTTIPAAPAVLTINTPKTGNDFSGYSINATNSEGGAKVNQAKPADEFAGYDINAL